MVVIRVPGSRRGERRQRQQRCPCGTAFSEISCADTSLAAASRKASALRQLGVGRLGGIKPLVEIHLRH